MFSVIQRLPDTLFGRHMFRHRIVSAGVPGVAAEDTFQTEPGPLYDAESVDRLVGIFRTGRMEPACPAGYDLPEDPVIEREGLLVEADENQDQFFHIEKMLLC